MGVVTETPPPDAAGLWWQEGVHARFMPGSVKMTQVHARGPDEKVVINVNEEGQPISDDQKTVSELSNFLGTLVKDNVSLTYINWHVVPSQLKNEMLEYTLQARYVRYYKSWSKVRYYRFLCHRIK